MVHRTGPGLEQSRDTGHATVAGNRDESAKESRFRVICALRSPARRSPRDSRNIAIALALLALAAIMFFVTIVKFEEQIHRDGVFRTRAEAKPPRVRTPGAAAGVAAIFSISEATPAESGTIPSLFDDSYGIDEDFDRAGDGVDSGDIDGGVALATDPNSCRPEGPAVAVCGDLVRA